MITVLVVLFQIMMSSYDYNLGDYNFLLKLWPDFLHCQLFLYQRELNKRACGIPKKLSKTFLLFAAVSEYIFLGTELQCSINNQSAVWEIFSANQLWIRLIFSETELNFVIFLELLLAFSVIFHFFFEMFRGIFDSRQRFQIFSPHYKNYKNNISFGCSSFWQTESWREEVFEHLEQSNGLIAA